MSEKIDEGKAREAEQNAVRLVRAIREMFAPVLAVETRPHRDLIFVDVDALQDQSRDDLLTLLDVSEERLAETELENVSLKERLETVRSETIETMFELAEERIEKERRERRQRMRRFIESLKGHRETANPSYDEVVHDYETSHRIGYCAALDMVIEILGLEEAGPLDELYDWFNRHQAATPSGPDAPPKPLPFPQPEATVKIAKKETEEEEKKNCPACLSGWLANHGHGPRYGCEKHLEKEPLTPAIEKTLEEVSVRELIEKGVTVEEMIAQDVDLKGLLSLIAIIDDWGIGTDVKERCPNELYDEWKDIATYAKELFRTDEGDIVKESLAIPAERIKEFDLKTVSLVKKACPGVGAYPIHRSIEETCEECDKIDECAWWHRRKEAEEAKELARVSEEEKTRLEKDLETLERNLDEPIKLGGETEVADERPLISLRIEDLPEEKREEIQRLLTDGSYRGFSISLGGKGPRAEPIVNLDEADAMTGIGSWGDIEPQPAPAPSTYRLTFRKDADGKIFPVLIDEDFNVWIGIDLRGESVSKGALIVATEGGKWWSESMVIPFQEEEETEESGTDDD